MAEVIAGIALAASVLQLTDQAGRTVKEVYGFLSSVKNAPETVEQTQATLAQIEQLSGHIQRYDGRLGAVDPTSPESQIILTIEETLRNCNKDLQALRDALPTGGTPGSRKFCNRIRVAFKDEKITKIIRRVENHEASLQLALTVVGRLQDITLCQDATLTNDLLRQQADDVAVLSYSLEATRFQLTDNLHNLQRTVEDVSFHQVALEARSNDANRAIAAALEVLRNEIRNQAPAIIDGILNTTSLRRLDWLQAVAETLPAILERATSHLDVQTQLTPLAFRSLENPSIAHRPPDESILYQSRTTTNHGTRNPLTSATLSEVQFYMSQTPRHSASHVSRIHQKSSTHNLFVGIIRLCIRRTITDIVEKNADSIVRKPFQSTTLVSLEFQPSQHLLRRGITIRFTRKTKTYGSPTTSAALTTFHTIPSDSPVFASIDENDRFSLQQLLESRQASLFDRDTSGNSLLHIAALKSSADTCEYLVSLGADPLLPNDAGRTALDLAMTRSVDVGMLEGTFEGMVEEVARRIGIFKIFIKAEVDFSEWDNTKWFARHECLPWKQQRRLNSTELRVLGELIPFLNKIGAQPMHRGKIDTHGLGACDSVYTMQVLLSDEKTDADIRDEDKRNALHLLAGRIEFNDCGWQKLTTAQIDFCYTAKVAILIEAGCRLHGVDMHGRTPTRLAIECGNSKRWSDGLANAGLTLADVVFEDDRLFPTKGVVEEVLEDFFRLDEPFD